mgnify:CR=1 FL=1
MPTINRSAIVPYTPDQMFALVDDIGAYPEFLPWCHSSREHERNQDLVRATVELAKGAVRKSFTTQNRLQHGKMIEMKLVDGPFKHLEGYWRFHPLKDGEACKVELDLAFEFSNRVIAMAIGPVFTSVANSLVDAFVSRANNLYRKESGI